MGDKVVKTIRWVGLLPAYLLACFVTLAVTSLIYRFAASHSFLDYEVGSLSFSLDRITSFGFASYAGLYTVFRIAPSFNERAVLIVGWAIIVLNVLGMAVGILFLTDRTYDYLAQIGIIIGSAAGLFSLKRYWLKSVAGN